MYLLCLVSLGFVDRGAIAQEKRLGRYNDAGTTRQLMAEPALGGMPAPGREALGAVLG
jgi:hypothetical protein